MSPAHALVPAAYVYLRRGAGVLLQLRQGTAYMDGHWSAGAAGHVEPGETARAAAVREVAEELGVEVDPADLEPFAVMHRTDGTDAPLEQRVEWYFTVRRWRGEPRIMEPGKCAELAWFEPGEWPSPVVPHELVALERVDAGGVAVLEVGFGAS